MSRKKTREEFIAEAKQVHGDKYDYSNVIYIDANTKVLIICPVHGDFWQSVDDDNDPIVESIHNITLDDFIKDFKRYLEE